MFRMSFHFRQTDLKFSGDLDFKIYRAVVSWFPVFLNFGGFLLFMKIIVCCPEPFNSIAWMVWNLVNMYL